MKAFLAGLAALIKAPEATALPMVMSRFEAAPVVHFTGEWGSGDPDNLELLAVTAMDAVLQHLHPAEIASLPRLIKVRYDQRGPMAVYEGEPGRSPAVMLLSATDKYWGQYLYQFSHELGHILCNFRRADLRDNRFQWLEESICGAVSLFCLQHLASNWPFGPDHSGYGFAGSIADYFSERRRTYQMESRVVDLRSWYLERAEILATTRALTSLNRPLSVWLYDRIEREASLLASLRYLNLWANDRSLSLTEHLLRWRRFAMAGRDALPIMLLAELGDVP